MSDRRKKDNRNGPQFNISTEAFTRLVNNLADTDRMMGQGIVRKYVDKWARDGYGRTEKVKRPNTDTEAPRDASTETK